MPVLSRPRSLQLRPGTSGSAPFIAVAFTVVACFVIATSLEAPSTVRQLTVVNQQNWAARVTVAWEPNGGGVPIGTVDRGATRTFADVLDHGGTWVLRFSYGGVVEEQVTSRDALAAEGWKVEVPARFGTRLEEAAVPPTPGRS